MATAYAQPAAANYYTTPMHPPQRQRGYRLCDQCGAVEQPSVRFRLCGGCVSGIDLPRACSALTCTDSQMTTQYCSQECQKMHWPSHKVICQHTASQISNAKHPVGAGAVDESLVKNLRKFVSAHSTLLGWAGFQALQLKRVPANVRQSALLVELDYRPSSSDSLRR